MTNAVRAGWALKSQNPTPLLHSTPTTRKLSIYSEYAYNSAKNNDNDMKLSEYDPWGLPSTSINPKPNPTSPTLICHDLSWPSHPIFVTMVTHPYISAKNQGNDTKLSRYDPLGLPSTSITPKLNPTSPTFLCHDLSWPSHPIKSNLHISAKSWWISTKFST